MTGDRSTTADGVVSVEDLARLIDPEVWAAKYEHQRTIGQQWSWETRRQTSTEAGQRVHDFLAEHRVVEVR